MRFAAVLLLAGVALADTDSDGDGLSDFQETHKYFTNPKAADSDGDGVPDGDWRERREYSYTVRSIVQVLRPVTPQWLNDDYQDVRVLHEGKDYFELEVIHYPLNTVGDSIEANPNWRRDYAPMKEYLAPGITSNWDEEMRRAVVDALAEDGTNLGELTDKEVVQEASAWLLKYAVYTDGFSTFITHFPNGRPAVLPGLEPGAQSGVEEKGLSLEEQWQRDLFAKGMFKNKTRGSCTSSSIYLNGCLRAIGIPTRIILTIPVVDASDEREVEFVRRLRHHRVRDTILSSVKRLGRSWSSHTYNEVFVGGRWRRLNYNVLGQNTLDKHYLGLMTHVATMHDWADAEAASTIGRRQQSDGGGKGDIFGGSNPYSTLTLSDEFGVHSKIENEPLEVPEKAKPGEFTTLMIDTVAWSDAPAVGSWIRQEFAKRGDLALLARLKEWDDFEKVRRFTAKVDGRFYLEAEGHPTLSVASGVGGITVGKHCWIIIHFGPADRRDLKRGVRYTLRARNSKPDRQWILPAGLNVVRQ